MSLWILFRQRYLLNTSFLLWINYFVSLFIYLSIRVQKTKQLKALSHCLGTLMILLGSQVFQECSSERTKILRGNSIVNTLAHPNLLNMFMLSFLISRFHDFLKQENEIGNITRQEAVSMVCNLWFYPLLLHSIYDANAFFLVLHIGTSIVLGCTSRSFCSWQ